MIGKGRFFDLITKTVEDINNNKTINETLRNYHEREQKFKNLNQTVNKGEKV